MSKRTTIDKFKWPTFSKLLLFLAVAVAWCWNWQLVLANGAGIALMLLVYCSKITHWQRYRTSLEQIARGYNGRLIIAVASGIGGALITYLIAMMWSKAEDHWWAIAEIVQLLGVLTGAAVLLKQQLKSSPRFNSNPLECLSNNLTAADPVTRLIAIRQLTRKLLGSNQPEMAVEVLQYFQLMLLQAPETIVKKALYESIEKLQHRYATKPLSQPSSNSQPLLQTKSVLRDWA